MSLNVEKYKLKSVRFVTSAVYNNFARFSVEICKEGLKYVLDDYMHDITH